MQLVRHRLLQLRKNLGKKPVPETSFAQLDAIPWISIWNLALAVGGFLLLGYFASIEFLPDLELKDLAGTIAAVAVVGIFIVVLIGGSLLIPALYLEVEEKSKRKSALYIAGVGIALPFFAIVNLAAEHFYRVEGWVILGCITTGLSWLITFSQANKFTVRGFFRTFVYVGMWAFWVVAVPMVYCFAVLQQGNRPDWVMAVMLFGVPAFFALLSLMLSSLPKNQRLVAFVVFSVVAVFLFSFVLNRPALVPQAVFKMLGLSVDREHVTLVLSENGCNAMNLTLKENGKPCEFDSIAKLGALTDARIVSRVGSQVVIHWRVLKLPITARTDAQLQAALKDGKNEIWQRVVLKKVDVISWAHERANP